VAIGVPPPAGELAAATPISGAALRMTVAASMPVKGCGWLKCKHVEHWKCRSHSEGGAGRARFTHPGESLPDGRSATTCRCRGGF